jgi:hypothetical protein
MDFISAFLQELQLVQDIVNSCLDLCFKNWGFQTYQLLASFILPIFYFLLFLVLEAPLTWNLLKLRQKYLFLLLTKVFSSFYFILANFLIYYTFGSFLSKNSINLQVLLLICQDQTSQLFFRLFLYLLKVTRSSMESDYSCCRSYWIHFFERWHSIFLKFYSRQIWIFRLRWIWD